MYIICLSRKNDFIITIASFLKLTTSALKCAGQGPVIHDIQPMAVTFMSFCIVANTYPFLTINH